MDHQLDSQAGATPTSSPISADQSDRALWAAVVLQAKQDIESEPTDSIEYAHAVHFFTGAGEWAEARTAIADFLNVHRDDLEAFGRRHVNQRRSAEGLPPLPRRDSQVGKARSAPSTPPRGFARPAAVPKPQAEPTPVVKPTAPPSRGEQVIAPRRPYVRKRKTPRPDNPFFPNGIFPGSLPEASQRAA